MMDIKRDLYAKFLCQISGGINEEGTSLMKLYLQAKTLVKAKKLERLNYPSDILMFLDRRKLISTQNLVFFIITYATVGTFLVCFQTYRVLTCSSIGSIVH
jgi:hypothetical protein